MAHNAEEWRRLRSEFIEAAAKYDEYETFIERTAQRENRYCNNGRYLPVGLIRWPYTPYRKCWILAPDSGTDEEPFSAMKTLFSKAWLWLPRVIADEVVDTAEMHLSETPSPPADWGLWWAKSYYQCWGWLLWFHWLRQRREANPTEAEKPSQRMVLAPFHCSADLIAQWGLDGSDGTIPEWLADPVIDQKGAASDVGRPGGVTTEPAGPAAKPAGASSSASRVRRLGRLRQEGEIMADSQQKIDWDTVRRAADDCLNATWSLVCFAEWSQASKYDANRAAAHLEAIDRARDIFRAAMEVLQPGLECASDDSIRYSPVFDALALATADRSERPVFRYGPVCCATAHEAAFELLRSAILWVENGLNAELDEIGIPDQYVAGIDDLHALSPEELRDTLGRLERRESLQGLVRGSGVRQIRAWIDHEWSAVSNIAAEPATGGGETRPEDAKIAASEIEAERGRLSDMELPDSGQYGTHDDAPKPSWDRIKAELTFNGETVRRIRRIGNAGNVVRVLDTFQELGWPDRVDSPLSPDSQKHHATIHSLNTGLSRIRFKSDGEGRGFIWESL